VKKYGKARQATDDKCFARSITKATNTHSEYVTVIASPQQQQWLYERASVLRKTYIDSLVINFHAYIIKFSQLNMLRKKISLNYI